MKHLVTGEEYNFKLGIFLIADILGLCDIKPTQAISIPSNPKECSSDAVAIGDVGVI